MRARNPIRRAQLIAPFGVGALMILKDGTSVITAGLDHWFEREDRDDTRIDLAEFQVNEWRLQRLLHVNHFRLPPDHRTRRAGGSTHPIRDSKSRAFASHAGTSAHTATGLPNNHWDFANGLAAPNAKSASEIDISSKFRLSLCAREATCKTFPGENGYTRASNPRASGHFASSQPEAQHSPHKK